jgi:FtsP/CotA-like multicopper oxidase with cupredoxin domain/thiol-disulfide isomerase/thioredoxin
MRQRTIQGARQIELSRRDLCRGLVHVGALLGSTLPLRAQTGANLQQKIIILSHPPSQGEFYHARSIRSENGVKALSVRYARCQLGDKEAWLRCYDGEPVGPTIRLQRGETLKLRVTNELPTEGADPTGHSAHETKNVTNVHFHGLHVSPQYRADNVLLDLLPAGSPQPKASRDVAVGTVEYFITVPEKHPAGTFWYHAHRHGSTAIQVASMMAGALIIEGDIDRIPEIKSAREFIFIFQQIPLRLDSSDGLYRVENLANLETDWALQQIRGGPFTTVNGIQNPIISMKVGEVQRWRFVNAGLFSPLTIQVVDGNVNGQPLYPIAMDGIPFRTIVPQTSPLAPMGPGNRMDVLFKAPRAGIYYLYKRDEQAFATRGVSLKENPHRLATIMVSEGKEDMPLPRPDVLRDLDRPRSISAAEAVPSIQRVDFDIPGGTRYVVNGAVFDPAMPPRTLILNNAQKWSVLSKKNGGDHIFHIHVNPFLLTERNGEALSEPAWLDTVFIPDGESVSFLTRYEDFTGKFVLHCHNLGHEDRGMMELVEIVPPPPREFSYFTPPFRVPADRFSDANGAVVHLGEFAGRVLLVNLWSSSCSGCRDELSRLAELQREIRNLPRRPGGPEPRGFLVVPVSWDADATVAQRFWNEIDLKGLQMYLDPNRALAKGLFLRSLPATMLIDGEGFVRGLIRSPGSWNTDETKTMITYFLTA